MIRSLFEIWLYRFNKSILVNRSRDEVGSVTTSRTLNTAGKNSRTLAAAGSASVAGGLHFHGTTHPPVRATAALCEAWPQQSHLISRCAHDQQTRSSVRFRTAYLGLESNTLPTEPKSWRVHGSEEVCSTYRVLAKGLLAGVLSPNAWFLSQMYRWLRDIQQLTTVRSTVTDALYSTVVVSTLCYL